MLKRENQFEKDGKMDEMKEKYNIEEMLEKFLGKDEEEEK